MAIHTDGRQPLNYLRQAREFFASKPAPIEKLRALHPKDFNVLDRMLAVAAAQDTPKFLLPRNGRIFNDSLKGLPDEIHLPFRSVVLEFSVSPGPSDNPTGVFSGKRIVVALEGGGRLVAYSIYSLVHNREGELWVFDPWFIELRRSTPGESLPEADPKMRPAAGVAMRTKPTGTFAASREMWNSVDGRWRQSSPDAMAVFELIEALSCSNVSHEALPVRKLNKGAARRGALPFDQYRILTVGGVTNIGTGQREAFVGDRRSPREHLRRGHIRKCASGVKVWVQSSVVNAGVGGRVRHDYDVRAAA